MIAKNIKLGLPVKGIEKIGDDKRIDLVINADISKFPPTERKINRVYGAKIEKTGIKGL